MDRRQRTTLRILDAAAATFARAGYAGTSMEDVAAAAGVSKLLLYRDFAGKKELYEAVLVRTTDRLTAVPLAPVAGAVHALLAVTRTDPDGYALLVRHAAREPDFAEHTQALMNLTRTAVEGQLRPLDPDPVLRAWAADTGVRLMAEALLSWLQHGDPQHDDEFCRRLLSSLRALAGPPAAVEPDAITDH